jgi:hypothetical protein
MEVGANNSDQEEDGIEDDVADESKLVEEECFIENPPIAATFAKTELERFSKDYFRSLLKSPAQKNDVRAEERPPMRRSIAPAPASSLSILDEPDLRVPMGDSFVHLAQ